MENGKNRSVETLKFDERANEESYFAAKEYELIEEMKTEFQKVETARREPEIVNCPFCPGRLEKYRFKGFAFDRCASCEGIWLEKGKLAAILRRVARGPLGAFLDRCFAKDEPGKRN
jgi:Zn-finger nucleic acid-binding protein